MSYVSDLFMYFSSNFNARNKWFDPGSSNWILHQDNGVMYRSLTEWKQKNGIIRMDWVSPSPTTNLIKMCGQP